MAKAIGAAIGGAAGGAGTVAVVLPPDVSAPWWGYILVAAVNALIAGFAAYIAPRNVYPDEVPVTGKPRDGR